MSGFPTGRARPEGVAARDNMVSRLGHGLPLVAPGLFVFLWSTGFIGARYGLPDASPLSFLLVRFVLVVVLMLSLALAMRAPWPSRWRDCLHIGVTGVLIHAVYLGGVFTSIAQGLPTAVSSALVSLQPLLTAVGASLVLSERVSRRQWIGLTIGLVGALLVISSRIDGGFGLAGVPAAFAALAGITLGTLYQKRFCSTFDYRSGAVLQFLPAAVLTGAALLLFDEFRVEWTGDFLFALGWLTLVLSLGAIGLLNYLIRTGSATHVASLFYMVPPCTAIIAWLMFDERLSALALAGIVVTVWGVYMARAIPGKG